MDKFGRNYKLIITRADRSSLTVKPPFTVEFDIHRNSLSAQNVGQIRVYNLNEENRRQIRKNRYATFDFRTIEFHAGYGDNLSLAFKGNITQAFSVREGNNMITQIECFDGGFAFLNAETSNQYPTGTPQLSIIESLISDLAVWGVDRGAIGGVPGFISKGNSYSGSTTAILRQLSGNGFFIDNGKANLLSDSEAILTTIPKINAESGLLGTPLLEEQFVHFDMLFQPGLIIGQQIELESQTEDVFNGTHKIISMAHRGIISEAVCGNAVTSLGLLPGEFEPVPLFGGL